jgi:hypothetical protein
MGGYRSDLGTWRPDYQIRVMEAIAKTLGRLDAEEWQLSLFSTEA